MMKERDISTEQRILDAAKNVFLRKGFDGARMQEIADEAGINKAMLHYYFRTKDRLFEDIFANATASLFPKVSGILFSDLPLEQKIRGFVSEYVNFIILNPFLPGFIIHEINSNPDRLIEHFVKLNLREKLNIMQKQLDERIANGEIRPIKAEHFIVNMMSMVIFPLAAKPVIKHLLNKNDEEFNLFLEERKVLIADFMLAALRV